MQTKTVGINFGRMAVCLAAVAVGLARAEAAKLSNGHLAIELAGQVLKVRSKAEGLGLATEAVFARKVRSSAVEACADEAWGAGTRLRIEHVDGWRTEVSLYGECPFAHVHTVAGNRTDEAVTARWAELATWRHDFGLAVSTEDLRVVGTGGLTTVADAKGSYTFSIVADPRSRNGVVCGWLTHERGVGVLFPRLDDGRPAVQSKLDFGRFRVPAGKTRPTDTMLIGLFADAREGIEAYADAVARQYAVKLSPWPGVYCTWYHSGASSEGEIAESTDFAAKHLKPFGLGVMQIDDKWQALLPKGFKHDGGNIKTTGPIKVFADSKDNYPSGMAHTAKMIVGRGMVAGIWFMPFAGNFRNPYFDAEIFAKDTDGAPFHDARWSGTCIDLTHPKAEAFVRKRVKRIHDWGYRYFKIDGMHTGMPSNNIYVNASYREQEFGRARLHDPNATLVQAYRKGLRILREEAPGTTILGCNVSQNMNCMGPAFGMIDAMRIGPDNGGAGSGRWKNVIAGAWHGTNLYFLNGRVWHNDPDPVYVRERNPIERARWMCSWLAVSGAMHTSSENYPSLSAERLDLLKRCLPAHGLPARPVDYLETDRPRIWLVPGKGRSVIGLFNWSEKDPDTIRYDLGRLGLDAAKTYVAFDFWRNEFVEPIRGALNETLPGGTCRVLAVRPAAEHPQLLSTSRHIAQCLVDVMTETWDPATRTLSGKSKVVADDRYELRIALPAAGKWKVKTATAGGRPLESGKASPGGVRLSFTPERTGVVDWRAGFE